MKGFICKTCGHVEFDEAPKRCPVCKSPRGVFTLQNVIKTKRDIGLKDKHIPVIAVKDGCMFTIEDCKDVHAKIGSISHPMELKHHILWADFYVNKKWVCRVQPTHECAPLMAAHLKMVSGKVSVIALCNIHGYWIDEKKI